MSNIREEENNILEKIPYEKFSIVSFITALFGLSIFSVFFGFIGLENTSNNKKRGRIFAILGVVLGFIETVIYTVLIVSFFII